MKIATSFSIPGAITALVAVSLVACGGARSGAGETNGAVQGYEASAKLEPRSDSKLSGAATFTVDGDLVTVTLDVAGVPPGEHAVHIHEHPDCSSHDAESAGGHWNPTMKNHGKWGVEPFHLGDIGNMTVAPDGTGRISLTTDLWTVGTGETNDVVGHSLMVHANPDDFVSQPSGNAGARIGCGAIVRQ